MSTATLEPTADLKSSPFDLADDVSYQRWRAWKIAQHPRSVEELLVEIGNPLALTPEEIAALRDRMARANMVLYRSAMVDENKNIPRALGAQLGLLHLDANWLADEDGISSITVSEANDGRGGFIPYTDRAIRWHTDGYYHPGERRIRGMILHCVRPALSGGVNSLLDHEMAYIALRDRSSEHIRALMQTDAMTIPARADEDGVARPAQTGPVFSVNALDGSLHMRYTARTRSIEWKSNEATRAAVAALEELLASDSPWILRSRMAPGVGLISHNVLHDRSGFEDAAAQPRLLYRARFLDRVTPIPEAAWRNG